MYLQSCLKTTPVIPQKSYPKFQDSPTSLSRKYLKLADFPVKIGLNGGLGGGPQFFLIGILLFMLLGRPRINLEHYDKPFWNIFESSPFSGQNKVNWGSLSGISIYLSIFNYYVTLQGCSTRVVKLTNKNKFMQHAKD